MFYSSARSRTSVKRNSQRCLANSAKSCSTSLEREETLMTSCHEQPCRKQTDTGGTNDIVGDVIALAAQPANANVAVFDVEDDDDDGANDPVARIVRAASDGHLDINPEN